MTKWTEKLHRKLDLAFDWINASPEQKAAKFNKADVMKIFMVRFKVIQIFDKVRQFCQKTSCGGLHSPEKLLQIGLSKS